VLFRQDYLKKFVIDRIKETILTEGNLRHLVTLINKELLETSTRSEKKLLQTEKQLTLTSNKLTKLYVALESQKLDLEALASRIKELRAYQQEPQKRRDHLLSNVNSNASESLDADTAIGYVKNWKKYSGMPHFFNVNHFSGHS
jgi:3-phenylpropionate/cinnamic acid dioxygenase small subunit